MLALVCIQIEDKAAVDNINGILKIEGVDVFFIGPSDLSQSMGYPGNPKAEPVTPLAIGLRDAINHMGHLNPCCTAVHHLDDILRVVGARTHDRRHPACLRGHNHQLDCLERDRPVLAIDKHPIEANTARHLDQLGRVS